MIEKFCSLRHKMLRPRDSLCLIEDSCVCAGVGVPSVCECRERVSCANEFKAASCVNGFTRVSQT